MRNSSILIHVCYAESACAWFFPKEIREKRKLLWSDGEPKHKKDHVLAVEEIDAPEDAKKPGLSEDDGDVGSIRYRLEVTANGNAVLKRGDFEVVWQALNK